MKLLFRLLVISFFLFGIVSCDCDDDNNNSNPGSNLTTFTATLNGASEVLANTSSESGMATLIFNNTTKKFTITVTQSIASPTLGHIHLGAVGVNGSPVFTFTSLTSPINYTSEPLTSAQEADLKANLYYVNIHTAAFPAGEIRGQLLKQAAGSGY